MPKRVVRTKESDESNAASSKESINFEENIPSSVNHEAQNVPNVASRFRHLLEPIRQIDVLLFPFRLLAISIIFIAGTSPLIGMWILHKIWKTI